MTDEFDHPDAPPGKAGKYAHPERERRFLLRAVPAGDPIASYVIEDRYLDGTRLRLRRMTPLDGAHGTLEVQRKLVQKVPAADGSPGLITNLYLSEAEYARLAELPAASLRKTRHSIPPFGVDVFEGALEGLILAEIEFATAEDGAAFEPSIPVVAEVTRDVRFTGGRLVRSTAAEVRGLLREFGL
jgi:CYTH domain-containing protein